jgi:hypothetical protein
MAKVLAISATISAAIVAIAYVIVMTVPTPLSYLFLLTGYSVAEALVPFIPDTVLKELASQLGGPLVAASALGTWFLIAWVPCFYLVWRRRSSSTPHTDARGDVLEQPSSAPAGERETHAVVTRGTSASGVHVAVGGLAGGMLVGYLHVVVLGYMSLLVSHEGYKHVGGWAFFLNGTASALVTALVVGVPSGYLFPRRAVALAFVIGAVAGVFLVYLGVATASERWWWVSLTDALQLLILLLLGAWLGSRLPVYRDART